MSKPIDAAYVAMLEARLKLAEAKAEAATGEFKIVKTSGVSKKNQKPYSGFKITGPAWGYVSDGLLRAIHANQDAVSKALAS